MEKRPKSSLDPARVGPASFVIEEDILRYNLSVLKHVKDRTGCKMFQALKTWSTWPLFHITKEYLDGTEVSSLNEARLGYDEFNHDAHMYAPAYSDSEFPEILDTCSTIIFNSFAQWKKFKPKVDAAVKKTGRAIECGLRINPDYIGKDEHGGLWSPCAPGSRLGIRVGEFKKALAENPDALDGVSGLHFHIFFDNMFGDLKEAVPVIEAKFGEYFSRMKWINFGGGQKITDDDYDVDGLIELVDGFKKRRGVTVHMEPGAAIVKNAGVLVANVLDIVERDDVDFKIAILDMSFNAHMPDFLLSPDLDMPVTGAKIVRDAAEIKNHKHVYRLAGGACVSGDQLMQWHAFKEPLKPGGKVVMEDAIQYNLVQCTMFNGVQHPAILLWKNGELKKIREFSYQDYRARMG
jgi:carboxynorspermidine decarboxylase